MKTIDLNKKLCLIYDFAPRYREGIYRLIDHEYFCHWYFGRNDTDIKGLDLSILRQVTTMPILKVPHTPFYWQRGVVSLLRHKEYDTYFMLGELFCLSTWVFVLCHRLFYRKKRIYFWTHGWYGKENTMRRFLKRIFFKAVDGVFLYGNYARELMLKEGFKAENLFVIHNSLLYDKQLEIRKELRVTSIYRNHFKNKEENLIFIGRLTQVKRLDLLIEALSVLKVQGKQYNLTLVGDGVEKDALQLLVKEKELDSQVWFYGACYDEAVNAELIYNADLCVSPGNVGLTAIHAMMFGTPVLTHDNFPYQMPEFEVIQSGRTGDFFSYNDVGSMTRCIDNWIKVHQGKREEVRRACYHDIDRQWNPQFQMEVIKKHLQL